MMRPERARARILTVNPEKRRVDAGLRDGGVVQVTVIETGPFFRWPEEGETWTLQRRNNTWYLDSLIEEGVLPFPVEGMTAGDAKVNANRVFNQEGKTLGIVIIQEDEPTNGKEGDLWYDTNSNSLSAYTGASWDELGTSSGTLKASVSRISNQSIPYATFAAMSWDTEVYDDGDLWALSPNPTRFTVSVTGVYHLVGTIAWGADTTGDRYIYYAKNGTATGAADTRTANQNLLTIHQCSEQVYLAAGDYIELIAYQSRTAETALNATGNLKIAMV